MLKNLLKIHNNNNVWKVVDVEKRYDTVIDKTKFFEVDDDLYNYIEEKLKYNNIIIEKEKLNKNIKKEDFILDELEESEKLRIASRNLVYESFCGRCSIIDMLEIYNFILANNKLASKGFYVTEDNKDEVYIDIIKSENEEDTEMLEKLLYAKDYLSNPYYWFEEYKKYNEDLECADSKEEIDKVTQEFLDKL